MVQVEWMLCDFVLDYYDWRVTAKTLDMLQPIFRIDVFSSLASIKHEKIKASFSKKELMRGMHYFLPAKIPYIQTERTGAVMKWPGCNIDPLRFRLITAKVVIDKPSHKRCLPNFAPSNQNQFPLV